MQKESRSRRLEQDDEDVSLSTSADEKGLEAPTSVEPPTTEPSLVGGIELDNKEYAVAIHGYDRAPTRQGKKQKFSVPSSTHTRKRR